MKISLITGQNGARILPDVANGDRIPVNFEEKIEILADGKPPDAIQPTPDGGLALVWKDGNFIVLENEAAGKDGQVVRDVSINGQLFAVGGGDDNANSGSFMDWTANYDDSPLHFEPLGPYMTSYASNQEAASGAYVEPTETETESPPVTARVAAPPPPAVDMPPVAVADTNWLFEDGPDASGNVLNDVAHHGAPLGIFRDIADTDPEAHTLAVASVNGSPDHIGQPIAGNYGKLVLAADGGYIYILNNANPVIQGLSRGETLTDTFTYTATDGTQTTSEVSLDITIFGTDDGAVITGIGSSGGDQIVYEHDLPMGSAPDASALVQHGTFQLDAPDGITSLAIGGKIFSVEELLALDSSPVILDSPTGQLVLHGFSGTSAGGTVDYTYSLLEPQPHPTADGTNHVFDLFPMVLTDEDGSNDASILTIRIVDDVPSAADDINGTASEASTTLTGNVFANDTQGADGAEVVPATLTGIYGAITIGKDGGYTYTLDPLDSDFAALTGGGVSTEQFQYTITDNDGDISPATLTLGIENLDDGVRIMDLTPRNQGGDVAVDEDDLPGGSDALPEAVTQPGTFAIHAPDGVKSLTIHGVEVITDNAFHPASITSPLGNTLAITNYDPATGVLGYTYTLNGPELHGFGMGENPIFEDFTVVLTDTDNDSTSDVLTARVVDDTPQAFADSNSIAEDATTAITGNVLANDSAHADVPKAFDGWDGSDSAQYGTIERHADGTYSYTLDNTNPLVQGLEVGQTLTETFDYTMRDADGDVSPATLTITINGTDDGVTITGIGATGGDEVVYEHDLPAGTTPDTTALTQSGSFDIVAKDGIATVQVGTVTMTLAQVQALGGTPVSIDTPAGQLVLNGYTGTDAAGTISYSYTLQDPLAHGGDGTSLFEDFGVTVTDEDGDSKSSTLSVRVVDDTPQAFADSNSIAEDTPTAITGNVLANDTAHADVPKAFDGWDGSDSAQYGTITRNPDGTYSYTLDNTNPLVQGLEVGQSLTETFDYTMRDADGDVSPATLTITINGTDDGVTITGIGATGGDEVVYEHDLPAGTTPDTAALTQTGSFDIVAKDGIATVQVGTVTMTLAQVQALGGTPVSIDSPAGQLVLNGYTGTDAAGTVSYSYTLQDPLAHGGDGTSLMENFAVKVTDEDGDSKSSTLSVRVVDDTPQAANDNNSIAEDTPTAITGDVLANDSAHADVPKAFDGWDGSDSAQYGTIERHADGTYSYTLDNTNPLVQGLEVGQTLTETFDYTMRDADGDVSPASLTITINGTDDGVTITGIGATGGDEVVYEHDLPAGTTPDAVALTQTGSFDIVAKDGIATVQVGTVTMTLAQVQALGGTPVSIDSPAGLLVLNGYTGTDAAGTISYSYTLQDPLAHGGDGTSLFEDFGVTVTDEDGDSKSSTLSVRVVDDTPQALTDSNSIAEDTPTAITGDVLANDSAHADVPKAFDGWDGSDSAQYGTITRNPDGTYSYTLDNTNPLVQGLEVGQTLTETFDYTMRDADGDVSPATLTITINGTDDGVTITGIGATGGDEVVYEHDLPAGTTPDAVALTQTGSFDIVAKDGIATVQVGTVTMTLAQVQALGTTSVSIDSPAGQLVLNGYTGTDAAGTISYSYTLQDPLAHGGDGTSLMENFAVKVTDEDGDSKSSTLSVRVVDDTPQAASDNNSIAEDATTAITGNVLANDTAHADVPKAFDGWDGSDSAQYGTIERHADGTYSYTLDNTNPLVQGLEVGQTLTETFDYTMRDADGDVSPATLTITINGTDDGVTITGIGATGGDEVVYEHDLPAGTTPDTTALTQSGSFDIVAKDGIATVQVGTVTMTLAQVQALGGTPVSIDSPAGLLVLNGYTGTNAACTISYSYTLQDPLAHGGDGTSLMENFAVKVTDEDGDSKSSTLSVRVVDDTPQAFADSNSIAEDATTAITGNVLANDTAHADVPKAFDGWDGSDSAQYGTITRNPDGTYSYTLDNTNPLVQGLEVGQSLTETFDYTMRDADGDVSPATLTITINGTDDGVTITGIGATGGDEVVYEHDLPAGTTPDAVALTQTGSFDIVAKDGIATVQVGTVTMTLAQVQALGGTPVSIDSPAGQLVLNGYTGTDAAGTISYSYTLQDPLAHGGDGTSLMENFAVKVTDEDGDSKSSTLSVRVVDDTPQAFADSNSIAEDTPTAITGNVLANDTAHADVPKAFDGWDGSDSAQYGTISRNADGTYSYTLDNTNPLVQGLEVGQSLTETFDYTMRDADGDVSPAALTITINGTDDGVTITGIGATGGDEVVYEHDLPAGTTPDTTALTQSGSFDIVAKDGIATVQVGTVTMTLAQVQALGGTPVSIDSPAGLLVLNGYTGTDAAGTVSYSYTLQDPLAHGGDGTSLMENFAVKVTDEDGDSKSSTLSVRVVDDTPQAFADSNSIAEDATTAITGDVLANDSAHADTPKAFDGWDGSDSAQYGTIERHADGTYSYTLDTSNPDVNGMQDGEVLTEQFSYTMRDADGDLSEAKLTITIHGGDDGPVAVDDTNFVKAGEPMMINAVVIFDHSGSMADIVPGTDMTRLQLAKQAVLDFAGQDNVSSLRIIGFDDNITTADISGWFNVNTSAGIAALDAFMDITSGGGGTGNFVADGMTDYDSAIAALQNNWVAPPAGADITNVYFLSDGKPTGDDAGNSNAISTSERTAWENFLTTKGINATFAIGVGADLVASDVDLQAVAFPNADNPDTELDNNHVIVINDADTLTTTLVDTLPPAVQGNVILGIGNPDSASPDSDPDNDITELNVVAVAGSTANVGTSFAGSYGTLVLHADGSYTYDLDDDNALVRALNETETLQDKFTYTIADPSGKTDSAVLTITVFGGNGPPILTGESVVAVHEAGLADGTLPSMTSLVAGGTVHYVDPGNDPLTIAVNGTPLGVLDGQATTVLGQVAGEDGNGYLTMHGDGSWTYTLTANAVHDGDDSTFIASEVEQFVVTVSDGSHESAPVTLTARITDDVIKVTDVGTAVGLINNGASSYAGAFNTVGADNDMYIANLAANVAGWADASSFAASGHTSLGQTIYYSVGSATGSPDGAHDILYAYTDNSGTPGAYDPANNSQGLVFELRVDPNADNYTFQAHAKIDAQHHFDLDFASKAVPAGPHDAFHFYDDGSIAITDGEPPPPGSILLTVTTLDPGDGKTPDEVNGSTQGFGVDNQWIDNEADNGTPETLVLNFTDPLAIAQIGIDLGGNSEGADVLWKAFAEDGTTLLGTGTHDGTTVLEIADIGLIGHIELSAPGDGVFRVASVSGATVISEDPVNLDFDVLASDSDGDTTTAGIHLTLDGGPVASSLLGESLPPIEPMTSPVGYASASLAAATGDADGPDSDGTIPPIGDCLDGDGDMDGILPQDDNPDPGSLASFEGDGDPTDFGSIAPIQGTEAEDVPAAVTI